MVVAKKSLGQHWLNDQASLQAMCAAADVQAGDTVLEIGPGHGSLTELLVKKAGQVIAVELDEKLAAELSTKVKTDNLQVAPANILKFNLSDLPPGYKIVANIPYYLTSHLIRVISEAPNPPTSAVLLVQKEVAERAAAQPGNMSILAVTAQFYWQVTLGQVVPAGLFTPPPKVDSQILILQRHPSPIFKEVDTRLFFRIVKAGFSQKRKTLQNSLGAGLQLSRQQTAHLLAQADISPTTRAQNLSLNDWHKLYQAFNKLLA